jgi:hypothetical protein
MRPPEGKGSYCLTSIWVESLSRAFDQGLDLLAAAVRDCTDDLWEASMWEVPVDVFGPEPPGPDGKPVTDPAARNALAQRRSAPWSVAWHALEVLDYDLTGELAPWAPPPPFAGNPHWLLTSLPAPWTRSEMLGYLDYCRKRVRDTLAGVVLIPAPVPITQGHPIAEVCTEDEDALVVREIMNMSGCGWAQLAIASTVHSPVVPGGVSTAVTM